jgi:hypothetical protein
MKYSENEPQVFIEYDVKLNAGADDITQVDSDGVSITATETFELLDAHSDVRVFIKPGTPPGRVRNTLKKIRSMIKKHGLPDFTPITSIENKFFD